MLRFFRHIRKQLMGSPSEGPGESRFRQYLLYAIGEIALVMIGILLALQVNNWNEQRKAKEIEYQVLMNIQGELKSNLEISRENLKNNQAILDTLERFLKGQYQNLSLQKKAEIVMVINNHSPLQLNMPAIEQELNISPRIQSYPDIREKLFDVSYHYKQVNKRLYYLDDTWTKHLSPLMTSEGSGRSFMNLLMQWDEDNYELGKMMDIPNYDDILSLKYSQLRYYISWIENLIGVQEEVLVLIEDETEPQP